MLISLLMDVIVFTLVASLRMLVMLVVSVWAHVLTLTKSYGRKDNKFYTVADDELIEDASLLPGETATDGFDAEDVPVRLLDDFTIYDWDTLRLVPISDLLDLEPGMRYGASGVVTPWTDDGTDDDSDKDDIFTPLATKLSPIHELNVHHFSPLTGSLDV